MKGCTVCEHEHRRDIERALFKVTPQSKDKGVTIERIAEEFDVVPEDLERHCLFHSSCDSEESIVRQIKMKEADLLGEAAQEYMDTMRSVGRRIRGYTEDAESGDLRFEKLLTKPVTDLYVGCGDGLQKTVRALSEINNLLNGPKDDGLSGLNALVNAINGSRTPKESSDD